MHWTLGIDLGTTNSVTAWMRDGVPVVLRNRDGAQATPSAVGTDFSGGLLVGQEALHLRSGEPRSVITEVKRLIGRRWDDELVKQVLEARPDDAPPVRESPDGSVEIRLGAHWLSPVQVSAVLLRRLRKDAEDAAGVPFRRAVITVPAYFAEPQFAAVREAGRLAGFHVSRIVQEPTAAAHAFGVRPGQDGLEDYATVLVFDLGGGTFDVSLLTLGPGHFSVAALGGDNLLGGADFDALLDRHLRERLGERDHEGEGDASRLRTAAERAKIELSVQTTSEVVVAPLGRQGGSWSGTVGRADFEELLTDHLSRMRETVQKVLTDYSATPEDVQRVLLVGGSTLVPAVRRALQDLFGEDAVSDAVDPMTAVAHGAAVEAGLLDTLDCPSESCTVERIPVASAACPACATPLLGTSTVDCPGCHVPAPELTAVCPVCTTDLSGLRAAAPSVALAECPGCGRDDNPAGATACGDCDTPLDTGGLKCPGCSMVNAVGLSACSYCGGDFGTARPQQVTAQHIGVELADGTVEVIFAGGTPYPTEWQRVDGLMIHGDKGAYVRFSLWEGPHLRSAQRNEFCGGYVHADTGGVRGDLPLTLQAQLDADRTIRLRYRIGPGDWHRAELRRNPVSHAAGRKAAALQAEYTGFVSMWKHSLTHAEHDALTEIMDDLSILARGEAVGRSLDGFLDSARGTLDLCTRARDAQAGAWIISQDGSGLLPQTLLADLRKVSEAVKDARKAMDTEAMGVGTERFESLRTSIEPAVRTALYTIRFAEQGAYPATLRTEVMAARDALRSAVAAGDQEARDIQLVRLGRLGRQGSSQFAEDSAPAASAIVLPSRQ
ncbi:actin-like ATPase involved in cell morphogenesis [Streptomyces sp. PvR006]|uniref:Hsp70 family protein n=1 Tax=Streptomyces sp. PvR006 TaxID=2817860 RepID=UPI001AE8BF66|nr:Hsp70 family protein [Streptomyces sp. PvR006]MBP2585410.1 actin-like ATPase involved in cell morphogenesis [Streptomyces sp. PvR006]